MLEATANPKSANMQQLREGLNGRTLPQAETAAQREKRLRGDTGAEGKAAKKVKQKKPAAAAVGGDQSAGAEAGMKGRSKAAGGRGGGKGKGRGGSNGGGRGKGGPGGRKRKAKEFDGEGEGLDTDHGEMIDDEAMGLSDG